MSSRALARAQTQRGRSGKKWVGLNYKEKEKAKEANGGAMPYTLSLITSQFPHKDEWSEMNLPDILFYIQPPACKYEGVMINRLIEDGKPVISDAADGHEIRQFEILPRHISLDVPGWLVEAWRRLDSRIGYQDILDRQYADPDLGLKKHTKNALQNHCRRECRKVLNTWVEYGRRAEPHRTEVEAIEGLSYENVQLNTTLKRSEVFGNRLVKVRLERRVEDGLYYAVPRKVTMENWEETTLPLDHFLPNGQPMAMTPSMRAAWEMYLILMERAAIHGFSHWSKLGRNCLPVTWYDRTAVKSVPNDTYDGGCGTCTWTLGREMPPSPGVKLEPDEVSSMTKDSKRRRSEGGGGEPWDLGDPPKAPKRRNTTRIFPKLHDPYHETSPSIGDVTFVETYRRKPEDYEYYSVSPDGKVREHDASQSYWDSEEDSMSNNDADDEDSEYEGNKGGADETDEEVEEDRTASYHHLMSTPFLVNDKEVVVERVPTFPPHDTFTSPSARRSYQRANYRPLQYTADGFSCPVTSYSHTEACVGSSNLPQFDPSSHDIVYNASVTDSSLLHADGNLLPTYLPASAFFSHQPDNAIVSTRAIGSNTFSYETSFRSVTTLPGAPFWSSNASIATTASSFTEAPHTATGHYSALPTPSTADFPIAHSNPLPGAESQQAYHRLSYPSPPQNTTYRNQLSFHSSPPRRPEPDWEWNRSRTRRHSDSDADFSMPNEFTGIGAFEQDLAISGYLDDHEHDRVLDLPHVAYANHYTEAHVLARDDSDGGDADNPGMGIATGQTIGNNFDNDFLYEQMNPKNGSLSALQV